MTYCHIQFRFKFHTEFSESLRLLGNIDQLGAWKPTFGVILTTNPESYPHWETEVPIKVPQGSRLEFKLAVFNDNQLKRWESLPNNENRYYRARYHSVILEGSEAVPCLSETIVKKFVSSQSLENLEDFKRVKKNKQIFNPFENAQNSFTSDSWDESSGDKISSDGFPSPRYFGKQVIFPNEEQTMDTDKTDRNLTREFGKDTREFQKENQLQSIEQTPKRKLSNPKSSQAPRILNPNDISDLERTLESMNDERPDIFSVLYQKYRNMKGFPRRQTTSLIHSESKEDLINYELEDELVYFSSEEPVIVACLKLPVTVNLLNDSEKTPSKMWKISEDADSHLRSIYKYRKDRAKGLVWIGWVGTFIEEKYREELANYLFKEYSCVPIFLEENLCQAFLVEYCNKFLHNAFFGFLDPTTISDQEDYIEIYNQINQKFAAKILEYANLQTLILIQNYHLMMVPKYLSQKNIKLSIAYKFDTPFPSPDVMRTFYNAKELVKSLLCADLICFTSNEHMKSFSRFCTQMGESQFLSEKGGYMYILRGGRKIYLRSLHPCIDFQHVRKYKNGLVQQKNEITLKEKLKDKIFILGFSYFTKFEAIENMLNSFKSLVETQKNQNYHFSIVHCEDLYLIDKNSSAKKDFVQSIKILISQINNDFANQGLNSGIEIIEETLTSQERTTLLEAANLLITLSPYIEDNVNILEYLFIKSNDLDEKANIPDNEKQSAGIIMSDFSIGLRSLSFPIRVNPFSKTQLSEGMKKALERKRETSIFLIGSDQGLLTNHTAWDQLEGLFIDIKRAQTIKMKLNLSTVEENGDFKIISTKFPPRKLKQDDISTAFRNAQRKVIICSYEDTLVLDQICNKIGPISLDNKILDTIKLLCSDPTVTFYIISEKKVDLLANIFDEIDNLSLLAENGFFYKMFYETNWYNMYECDWSWKNIVQKIMHNYAVRIGGVRLEIKESSVVWNYKDADSDIVKIQENELVSHLSTVLTHVESLEIIRGRAYVEVKAAGVNKGVSAELILSRERLIKGKYPDFVLCLGTTRKDEEMFGRIAKMLKENSDFEKAQCYTCTVGKKPSNAKYYVDGINDVYETLNILTK